MSTSSVILDQVTKSFSGHDVIKGVSLEVKKGELVVFVGPSGCGKSTLLRLIAGLETPTSGRIDIAGENVTYAHPSKRGVAMVFQSYALYPHMTVEDNIGFALRIKGMPRAEIKLKVRAVAETLQLGHLLHRLPKALSGGQRQRVAIGRAMVREPDVFLFDEPLSNLDASLRGQMRVEIAGLHARLGATSVYVTHDQVEAMTLAEKGGVPKAKLLEVFTGTLFDAPAYRVYGPILAEQRFRPAAMTAPLGLKDMRLVGQAAEASRVPMPLLNVLRDHLLQTIATEGEDIDWSAIGRTVARNGGLP